MSPVVQDKSTDPKRDGNGGMEPQKALATQFWLELDELPDETARSLWLYIDEKEMWKKYDNPTLETVVPVQNAFVNPDKFEVWVWYFEDQEQLVGLVVKTAEMVPVS